MKKFYLLFLLLLSTICHAQINLTQGLVMYLPFNGNTLDASGNNNNATNYGATLTTDKWGNVNSAYHFDGVSSYMKVLNASTISTFTNDNYTLCAYVKPQGFYTGSCHGNDIVDKGDGDFIPGWYTLRFSDAYSSTFTNCSSIVNTAQENFDSQHYNLTLSGTGYTPYITLNLWYCLVAVANGTDLKLYINGSLVSTQSYGGAIGMNNNDLYLGKKNSSAFPYWFTGDMDEVRIYNRAINTQEIDSLCNFQQTNNNVCLTNTLDISTGYDPYANIVCPTNDIKWNVTYLSPGNLALTTSPPVPFNAVIVPTNSPIMASVANPLLHSYIDFNINHFVTSANQIYTTTVQRTFKTCIDDSITISVNVTCDNFFTDFMIDGQLVAPSQPPVTNTTNYSPGVFITKTFFLPSGTHTISISLGNTSISAGNWSEILVEGNLTSKSNSIVAENNNCSNYNCSTTPTASITPNFTDSTTFKDCKSATVQFTDKSTATNTSITSWNWNFGDGNSSTLQNPLHTYTLPGNYTVSLTVKDATGLSQTTSQTLSVSFVLVNFTTVSGSNFSCGGTAAQLHAAGAVSYSWSPCSYLSNCTDSTPTATPPITTTYVLTSTNTQGCIDVDTITVHVNEGEQAVFVPNSFSPNGDNINDCFMVRSYANFITFALHIYNRWGQEIFSTTDPTRCWYGENKNGLEGAEMGTYFYYLKATTDCGKVEKKGDITLVR